MEDVNWDECNSFLSSQIAFMIQQYSPRAKLGLDVGCQAGEITRNIVEITGIKFCGIEPFLSENRRIKKDTPNSVSTGHSAGTPKSSNRRYLVLNLTQRHSP